MLIHATVTITGAPEEREACEAHLRRALAGQRRRNDVTEHHGKDALCYDLKVEGGIPFPVFAQASQEFPGIGFLVEWVNVAAGERGSATFVNGRLAAQQTERIATAAAAERPVFVAAAADGRLRVALTLHRTATHEWRGYGVTAARDALLRVRREPGSDAVQLHATEGAPEWAVSWRGALSSRVFVREELQPPVEIDQDVFRDLDALARSFAADWIWFSSAREEDIAVERDRYARYGYVVADANLRSLRLHQLRAGAGEGRPLEHSTLSPEDVWLKDVVLATWAKPDES